MSGTAVTEEALLDRIKSGRLIEDSSQATERYIEGLKRTLIVSADTELISAPAYMNATKDFSTLPSINNYITVMGIVQDELGHAHIAYRMLRDLGVDTEELVYERKPKQFKHPYAFDVPLESFTELIVANGFYDRAGFVLLSDIHRNCSYGPWKRALVKVDREENFHLRHGEKWMKAFSREPEKKEKLQQAVDWMFPLTATSGTTSRSSTVTRARPTTSSGRPGCPTPFRCASLSGSTFLPTTMRRKTATSWTSPSRPGSTPMRSGGASRREASHGTTYWSAGRSVVPRTRSTSSTSSAATRSSTARQTGTASAGEGWPRLPSLAKSQERKRWRRRGQKKRCETRCGRYLTRSTPSASLTSASSGA
jgi:1,2-phenylacetyl-CoA epoxidase catalytic subunit